VVELPPNHAVLLTYGYKFRLRKTEWIAAAQCFLWGFILLLPTDTFMLGDAYAPLRAVVSEEVLGVIMVFAGALRLAGLLINGARRRVTPWMRLGGALVGFLVFLLISLGFAASGVIGTWIAAWPVVVVVEAMNLYDTTRDARQAHG
jgi:hypothetical protein